jgi:hypothetical protein
MNASNKQLTDSIIGLMGGGKPGPVEPESTKSPTLNNMINDVAKNLFKDPSAAVDLVKNSKIPGAKAVASLIPAAVDAAKNLGVNENNINELTSMFMNSGSGTKNRDIIQNIETMLSSVKNPRK